MADSFQIGTARSSKGERVYGEVVVTHRVDGTPISIPIILVQGKKPGPTLCLNGCIHGDEFSGMEAITRLANELDPAELSGILVAVPVVNQPALEDTSFINHYDHLNLNRIFPGSPTGSLTNKIADAFLNQIALKCNAMVDLHGGGGYSRITKVVVAQGGFEKLSWDLALATGFDLLWLGGAWGGTGRISALQAGIPAITVESGGGMVCTEADVAVHYATSKNIMRYLGMIPGQPEYAPKYRVIKGSQTFASKGGFFHPVSAPGKDIQTGEVLATISDMHGRTIEELCAPISGVVVELRQVPTVLPGDVICILGEVVETRERNK
jgi:predicted deacylase